MLKSQYCVHTRVQFIGRPFFVISNRSIPVTISGAEMQSCSLLEVRHFLCVRKFDVRLVTNETPNTGRPQEGTSYNDTRLVIFDGICLRPTIVVGVKGL
jgi:hypothetical protein